MRNIIGPIALVVAIGGWACSGEEGGALQRSIAVPGAMSGAIFTTVVDGSRVDANIYDQKEDVYLDGGPGPNAPAGAAGLEEGDYYFQVTDPSGKDLLSSDHISCRKVHINEHGVISAVYAGTNYVREKGKWVPVSCQHATGVDVDHPELGAITVQLFPYDDTRNKGGVYKAWLTPVGDYAGDPNFVPQNGGDRVNGENWEPANVHGFIPSRSKTDNFKVRQRRPYIPPELAVFKFHDRNLDAVQNEGEEDVVGWLIAITDPIGTSNQYFTPVGITATAGSWLVVEDTPPGTLQTAAYLDGTLASSYPTANPLVEAWVDGDSGEYHEVVYGNVGLGDLTVCKYFDRDGDGVVTGDDVVVPGWRFELTGTDVTGAPVGPFVQTAGEDGCTVFAGLLPGSYTITELLPAVGHWTPTGPTSQSFEIESSLVGGLPAGTSAYAAFTNRCEGLADFDTKGYWHNKNGLTELSNDDISFANGLAPYAAPSEYFGAGDEPFDGQFENGQDVEAALGAWGELIAPAGSARAEVSHFLVDPNAGGDPREQLAQQLLAFVFNALNRLDGFDAELVMPDGSLMTAGDVIDGAITAWQSGSDAQRNAYASLLDAFNNDDSVEYVPAVPCPFAY